MVALNNVLLVERSNARQNNVKRFSSGAITVLSDVPNWRCVLFESFWGSGGRSDVGSR